jgi:hypothetical protein
VHACVRADRLCPGSLDHRAFDSFRRRLISSMALSAEDTVVFSEVLNNLFGLVSTVGACSPRP